MSEDQRFNVTIPGGRDNQVPHIIDREVRRPFLGSKSATWAFFGLEIFGWIFFPKKRERERARERFGRTFLGLINTVGTQGIKEMQQFSTLNLSGSPLVLD